MHKNIFIPANSSTAVESSAAATASQSFQSPADTASQLFQSPGFSPVAKATMEARTMEEFKRNVDMSTWEHDYHLYKDWFRKGEVSLEDYIDKMRQHEKGAIMWHIGEDDNDLVTFIILSLRCWQRLLSMSLKYGQ